MQQGKKNIRKKTTCDECHMGDAAFVVSISCLSQNYPNPFNPTTSIRFFLETGSSVRLAIYDLLGRPVATLIDEATSAGDHWVTWDAGNAAAGVYYYRLNAGAFSETRKMLLVK